MGSTQGCAKVAHSRDQPAGAVNCVWWRRERCGARRVKVSGAKIQNSAFSGL